MNVEIVHQVLDVNGNLVLAESTPFEPWYDSREFAVREGHVYAPLVEFALDALGEGVGRSCLVVGSPVFEATELQDAGWKVDYLDIRQPPTSVHWIAGDASVMPIETGAYDAFSSTCVLCHVGLGRYGDTIKQGADFAMMREIARVLKPGGLAALCAGPVSDCRYTRRLGSMHRVYTLHDVEKMVSSAGLDILKTSIWNTESGCWRGPCEAPGPNVENIPDYLSMFLRRN